MTPATLRRLGRTEIHVTPIGLGVMQFAGGSGAFGVMFPILAQEEMNAIVRAALAGGINWFDTAEIYGMGRSELGLATALRIAGRADRDVVVATKWFPILRTAGNIRRTVEARLRYLEGYTIDVYMVHQPWGLSTPEAEMDAMADLVDAGKIRSVGVSNFSARRMARAHRALERRGLPLAVNQVHYSLLRREIETNGILDAARDLGVTLIAYTPLGSGLLTGRYHRDPGILDRKPLGRRLRLRPQIERSRPVVDVLSEIASRLQVTPAQVALNWLIHSHGDTVVAIPGATRPEQAAESAGAMGFRLDEADIARLNEVSRSFR